MAWNVDADPRNADWPKRSWDLPPYKSEEFMEYMRATGRTLEQFRQTPVYLFCCGERVNRG